LLFSTVVFIKNADPFFCKKFYGNPEKRLPSFLKRKTVQEFFCTVFSGRKKDFIDRDWVDGKMGKERSKFFYLASTTAVSSSVNRQSCSTWSSYLIPQQKISGTFRIGFLSGKGLTRL